MQDTHSLQCNYTTYRQAQLAHIAGTAPLTCKAHIKCHSLCVASSFLYLSGGITRVSEALEVIDKSARLDAATAAAAARATSASPASDGQAAGEDDTISFA